MPFDGTEYHDDPEISLEEKALRHALAFFSDESKWMRGDAGSLKEGRMCVGMALVTGGLLARPLNDAGRLFVDQALGVSRAANWNDTCPDFKTMKAHLETRIAFYQQKRLANSYIVVIGPGRQVRT